MTMDHPIAGIRFSTSEPLVFCYCDVEGLARGQHVVVIIEGERREGMVALAPAQVLAAPPLGAAPRVVGLVETPALGGGDAAVPPDVDLLLAPDSAIGADDLARALALAALPAPQPGEERH